VVGHPGPVMDVVPLAEAGTAAREATAAIPVVERSTDRRRIVRVRAPTSVTRPSAS